MQKVTEAYFNLFKKEALKYIKSFELDQWEVYFIQESLDHCRAQLRVNYEGRIATFVLTDQWDSKIVKLSNDEMRRSAKHEAIELLLVPITFLGSERFGTEEEYNAAREEVVRKIEKRL